MGAAGGRDPVTHLLFGSPATVMEGPAKDALVAGSEQQAIKESYAAMHLRRSGLGLSTPAGGMCSGAKGLLLGANAMQHRRISVDDRMSFGDQKPASRSRLSRSTTRAAIVSVTGPGLGAPGSDACVVGCSTPQGSPSLKKAASMPCPVPLPSRQQLAVSEPQAPPTSSAKTPNTSGVLSFVASTAAGIVCQPRLQQTRGPLLHALWQLLHGAAVLLAWSAGRGSGRNASWGVFRWLINCCSLQKLQLVSGLLLDAWRSWASLPSGDVKDDGLHLLTAHSCSLQALATDPPLLLVVAQRLASAPAAALEGPAYTELAALPGLQQLLANHPDLLDTYLRQLGRWVKRGLVHHSAAWQVLVRLPRCWLVMLAQQRLYSAADPAVRVGAEAVVARM